MSEVATESHRLT